MEGMECLAFLRTIGLRQRVVWCEGAEQNQRLGRGTFASEISTLVDIGKHRCHQFRLSQFLCQVIRSRAASTQALAECPEPEPFLSKIETTPAFRSQLSDFSVSAFQLFPLRPVVSSQWSVVPFQPFSISAFQLSPMPPSPPSTFSVGCSMFDVRCSSPSPVPWSVVSRQSSVVRGPTDY